MSLNNQHKDKIQQEALQAWLKHNKHGTVEIITGLGKTFIFLHALYEMPKGKSVTHLFLAEVTDRKSGLGKDIIKYNEIFNRDVFEDYNLIFATYQSAYKWEGREFGLVGGDEIHDACSPAYSKFFFNNHYKAVIGLSATINKDTRYVVNDRVITKGEILDKIAPICYTYNVNQGQKDGTARKLNIYVIEHKLDAYTKNVKAGNAKKPFYQTELQSYQYWDKEHRKSWFIVNEELKRLKIRVTSSKRSKLLYNLESKIPIVKTLLNNLRSKTIIFSNSLDSLAKVTPNIVSSKNTDLKNDQIKDAFDRDKISVIGSFKKLKQGANLKGLDNCIIMSYYGTDKDFIQRIGRLRNDGTIGNVFIILTLETQEEIWFSKMMENSDNLNLIYCKNVEDCINKLNDGKNNL